MSDQIPAPQSPDPVPHAPSQATQQPLEESVTKAFVGANGIRAGWRLLIFVCIFEGLLVLCTAIVVAFNHGEIPNFQQTTPRMILLGEGMQLLSALVAAWIMSKIEARNFRDYGLPAKGAFGVKFWQGIIFGFAAITFLLVVMRGLHVFYFGPIALRGSELIRYACEWGVVFLLVGFLEEFLFRAYPLFTLATGVTFWPAAILVSLFFGYVHRSNPGESWLGLLDVAAAGFLFCIIVRRTGDLWMAIGFHAAWDWGQTYFYGVADSGLVAPGHLFNSHLAGPAWLSGGSVGPEGSWLCLALEVILCILFALWLPEAKYPNPDAIPDPRKKLAAHHLSFLYIEPPAPPVPPAPPPPAPPDPQA